MLIHTPLLRDYFLSDRHMCLASSENACIVCEIAQLFQVTIMIKREDKSKCFKCTMIESIYKLFLEIKQTEGILYN